MKRLPNVQQVGKMWRYRKVVGGVELRSPATFASAEDAYRGLLEALAMYNVHGAAIADMRPTPTIAEIADQWIALKKQELEESTIKHYQSILRRRILPVLGERSVDSITRADVRAFLADTARQRSQTKTVLSGLFILAQDGEWRADNPVLGVRISKAKGQQKAKPNPFTSRELEALWPQARRSRYYRMWFLMARTGIRYGECAGLQWGDIDWQRRTAYIQRQFHGGKVTAPKSAGSIRRVDLTNDAIECLREQATFAKELGLRRGQGRPEWVFPSRDNLGPIDHSNVAKEFKVACRRAGLEVRGLHQLRHTYASLLFQAGVDPTYIQRQLGHASLKLTLDTYTAWLPRSGRERGVDVLDKSRHILAQNQAVIVDNQ